MKLILTSAFFINLIISAFGLVCWQGGIDMPDSKESPVVGPELKYRCAINPNTGEFEMGNSKNQII